MKEVKAVFKTTRLHLVVDALKELRGLPGFTLSLVSGFSHSEPSENNHDYDKQDHVQMAKIEIVVSDDLVGSVVQSILGSAHTGLPGDGKIFVCDVFGMIKIRTGERQVY